MFQENSAEDGEDVRLEVLFPNSITGAVIGRSGETIKELRSKTNTQILVREPNFIEYRHVISVDQ